MSRYFIEVSYKGTNFAGFQKQNNAHTIQSEIEQALKIYFRKEIELTGSSRTDAGVHALQNFFHFDENEIPTESFEKSVYHLNAMISADVVIKGITLKHEGAHSRFDAKSRRYLYTIYQRSWRKLQKL
ncbi:MAG: tRNA pseudouridine synthase A [Sphingobacteriales bacterium]|nr:tRNA pseudouridine synthase A [Sphingobacteriales bacterium]